MIIQRCILFVSLLILATVASAQNEPRALNLEKAVVEQAVVGQAVSPSGINLNALKDRSLVDLNKIAFEKENPYEIRWSAIQKISVDYPDQAEAILLKAVTQPEWYMKNAALIGLEQIKSKKLMDAAERLISDPALVVRSMAVNVLSQNQTTETRKLFWSELKKKYNFKRSQSLWIRYQILEHLAENPLKSEREKFLELINEKDKKIQSISKNVIIKIQTKSFQ